jgi:hypothetical protein
MSSNARQFIIVFDDKRGNRYTPSYEDKRVMLNKEIDCYCETDFFRRIFIIVINNIYSHTVSAQ